MTGSLPTLPLEIWLYIHRLAVSDSLPPAEVDEVIKYGGMTPDHPLNDRDLQNFLKVYILMPPVFSLPTDYLGCTLPPARLPAMGHARTRTLIRKHLGER
jgi:hypothetical protein